MNLEAINNWPDSWKMYDEDIEYGKEIILLMKPFIEELSKLYSSKTLKTHIDNLWVLGGYTIEHINEYEKYRDTKPILLLTTFIDSCDGPTIHDLSKKEQISFDCTCRKFYKYLAEKRRW